LKLLKFFNKNRKKISGKKRRIFASAVLVGNLLFGNLKPNDLKTNPNPVSPEKVISNQEFNSFDGSHKSGKIILTGNGTILEFQQEIPATSSNDMDEIILVKDDGILPGADGFPLNNNPRRRAPFGRPRMRGSKSIEVFPPQNIQGLGNIPEAPKVRSFMEVETGLNARRGNRDDQCPAPEFDMKKEYENFIQEISEKGYQLECNQERFNELSTNPQTGKFDQKSIFEAEGGLQAEAMGLVKNLRRTENPIVDLDFQAELVDSGKTIFVDHKGMIDFGSLSDKGVDISGFPSHESVAFNMGKDSVEQKGRFVGVDQGPTSRSDVVHLYNFKNIRNTAELPLLMQAVLNGAEQAGYTDGIIFLNYKE